MKRRDLSGEERELWSVATRDVKPSKKRARATPKQPPSSGLAPRQRAAPSPVVPAAAMPAGKKPAPVLGGGDPKADRRAAKGLIPIERTLDLHGEREVAAQAMVSRFILSAHGDGVRLVLVITGKGAARGGEGRGVIRRRFVDWVEAPSLRGAIARVAPAKPKDGGAGAFYVFLKRKTRG